jgi:protein phosphatase
MGGAQAGEVASRLAAAALEDTDPGSLSGPARIESLIQEANRRVHERAIADPSTSGMGTTMTVALVEPDGRVVFGHVGDSRAYLLRDSRLEQLTDDHTLVAELVRRGELSPSDAEVHPQRSVITRALGTDPDVDVDTFALEGRPGDIVLLCSDGLSSMVSGATIEKLLDQHRGDLQTAGKALIHAANRGGGEDNITAVLFELADGDAPPAPEPDQPTREHVTTLEDEDTLHPEDHVELPPTADTMVVPAAELHAALGPSEPASPQAGLGRRLLALLVIAVLIAVIVVLVWWGLAR